MPDELLAGAAFPGRTLVDNRVSRAWVSIAEIEASCPPQSPHYRYHLFLGDAACQCLRDRKEFNRMLLNQVELGGLAPRLENQASPVCPHRLHFAFIR